MSEKKPSPQTHDPAKKTQKNKADLNAAENTEKEIHGYEDAGLPEPTRYGDWEVKGRCSDF